MTAYEACPGVGDVPRRGASRCPAPGCGVSGGRPRGHHGARPMRRRRPSCRICSDSTAPGSSGSPPRIHSSPTAWRGTTSPPPSPPAGCIRQPPASSPRTADPLPLPGDGSGQQVERGRHQQGGRERGVGQLTGQGGPCGVPGRLQARPGGEELGPQPGGRLPVAHREQGGELRAFPGSREQGGGEDQDGVTGGGQEQGRALEERRPPQERVRRGAQGVPGEYGVGEERGAG